MRMNNELQKAEKPTLDKYYASKSIFTAKQLNVINTKTPRNRVYERPAKGGGKWAYVQFSYMRKKLDRAFGGCWDFEIETSLQEAFDVAIKTKSCVVKGKLTVKQYDERINNYVTLTKTQFGRADIKFKKNTDNEPLDFGNDMKAAATDCIKKCASYFGIAADIYEKNEFIEVQLDEGDVLADEAKVAEIINEYKGANNG